MRIYIHTDLEGVSGVDNIEMIQPDNPRYEEARLRLTEDINAAVEGALAGGAEDITVLDSHGGGTQHNVVWEKIHPAAEREPRPAQRWWGHLDETFDGTFFIGAHAMAGTVNAFLDHTQSSVSWYDYYVNGRRMGEMAQWAMVAGHFGVPFVMMAGDEAAVAEAYAFFDPVETAAVKRGVGRMSAVLVDLDEAHQRIYDAARRAISVIEDAEAFQVTLPMEIICDFTRTDYTDSAAKGRGIERIGPRRVRKVSTSQLDIFPH